MKKTIRLTEGNLRQLIENCVRKLNEDYRESRPNTMRFYDLVDEMGVDWEEVAKSLLGYMSDNEVGDWAESEGYFDDYDEEEEEEEDYDEYDGDTSVYSMEDWKKDGSLNVEENDFISNNVFDQLLNSQPPKTYKNGIFQPGEPYSHKNGVELYQTFKFDNDNDLWYYEGLMPAQ